MPCTEKGSSGLLEEPWFEWGERRDLNPRPPGPQPGALPTELLPPRNRGIIYHKRRLQRK